jgi:hypothetical protein
MRPPRILDDSDRSNHVRLRKGMKVRELTKRVGQVPRVGTVTGFHGHSVDVRWDDGGVSSVSGAYLFPTKRVQEPRQHP